jgi:hypothetical protein
MHEIGRNGGLGEVRPIDRSDRSWVVPRQRVREEAGNEVYAKL